MQLNKRADGFIEVDPEIFQRIKNPDRPDELLRFLIGLSKLSEGEISTTVLQNFINLNKVKGSKNLQCCFPNCTNIEVKKSHLFARTFLESIAEDGQLLTRSYYPLNQSAPELVGTEKIGVSEAMTFPGFCSKCEQKFNYERNRNFENVHDFFL